MKIILLFLISAVVSAATFPISISRRVPIVEQRADVLARDPFPIPVIPNLDPAYKELLKRANNPVEDYTFGTYRTKKSPDKDVLLKAEFNKTIGSSWCNEIDGVGSKDSRDNIITSLKVVSHEGWTNPGPERRPPEYVCFVYESRDKCDPKDGHAEYIESVPGPKGSANSTTFDTKYKYISWGCQWHPENIKCNKGDNGTGHKPGEECKR